MRLVVVGSVASAWTEAEAEGARAVIRRVIEDKRAKAEAADDLPFTVGSGRSPGGGVDIWAEEIAGEMGVTFEVFAPTPCINAACGSVCSDRFNHQFRVRDQQMADWCSELVRVRSVNSRTYGSGWTRDRAADQHKPTEEHVPNDPQMGLL